jgi:hypothetical protein
MLHGRGDFVKDIKRNNIKNMEQLKGDISITPKILVLNFENLRLFALRKAVDMLSMLLK